MLENDLVCLLLEVDFTNVFARIFRVRFSYERLFSSYVFQKTRTKSVGEIDPLFLTGWIITQRSQNLESK